MPSPTDLKYFIEIANCLNISRAAKSLGISQPSLTLAMRRLEDAIGAIVFIRHKRGVTLTPTGKHLLTYARQLLQQWEAIKTEALAATQEIEGCFTLGCHVSVACYMLPHFLGELLKPYPKLELKLKHDLSRKITEDIIDLKVDIGLVVNPIKYPNLVIKKLFDDEITLWHSPITHAIQDIHSGQAILLCDPDLVQTQFILKNLKKAGISYQRLIATGSLEVIAELTAQGNGVGILPARVAANRQLIPIANAPSYADEVCLLYRGENRHIKAIELISATIQKAFKGQE